MREGHATGVLITRPEPGAAETAARVAALGLQPVLAPGLVLAPATLVAPQRAQAVLLTSRAAARALPDLGLPILAVGTGTAAEATARGFGPVAAAAGDAAALAGLAAARLDPAAGPLLLAVGAGYGQDLALALRARGFRVLRRIAYRATAPASLPPGALEALGAGQIVAALFFSPRSAECAITLLRQAGLASWAAGITALAISPRVAERARSALAPATWGRIGTAARPEQDLLVDMLRAVVPEDRPGPG